MAAPCVVKIGGSMLASQHLLPWLQAVRQSGSILVTGGGVFADAVRSAQKLQPFANDSAHFMAMSAMCQFAQMCCALMPGMELFDSNEQAAAIIADGRTPVWRPQFIAAQWPDLPADWSVSADTMALRLAAQLQAKRLVLVKAAIAAGSTAAAEAPAELLDLAFAQQRAIHGAHLQIYCYGPAGHMDFVASEDGIKKSGGTATATAGFKS